MWWGLSAGSNSWSIGFIFAIDAVQAIEQSFFDFLAFLIEVVRGVPDFFAAALFLDWFLGLQV